MLETALKMLDAVGNQTVIILISISYENVKDLTF